ncbi:MAG: hypothetical protein ABSA42_05670 [Terracidiphilus sp.]
MNAETENMARNFFGFGRWDAPYWFIGPEQGGDDNSARAAAFSELQKKKSIPDGLCDCLEFHKAIQEERWHFKEPPDLQWTWKRLMLSLMTYLGTDSNDVSLINYQRACWGRTCGDTCVIELSGLSFKSSHESGEFYSEAEIDLKAKLRGFKQERINLIREKVMGNDKKPELVVLYGYSQERYWKQIAKCDLPPRDAAKRAGNTVFVYASHPAAYGTGIDNSELKWRNLGQSAARELMR